jgi:ADP-L-glycero-D-manno-heptose-6-epimerase
MIIVTGGAGFIGSNILAGLEAAGYRNIVVADRLRNGEKWKNIAKRNLTDVVHPDELGSFLTRNQASISHVIHMGAISTTTERDVDLIVRSNIRLTWDLWEFCRDAGKRFIYASSAATYGAGEHGFEDDASPTYLNALRPLNPYGWSKAFIDRRIAGVVADSGRTPPQFVGLKFFNVYGPNEYHKGAQQSVVAHVFPKVKNDEPVPLFRSYDPHYADGAQERDFVWIGDVVDVVLWMVKNESISGLFNVGSGEARTFRDLATAAWTAMRKSPQIEYVEMPESLRRQYQYHTLANLSLLRMAGYTKPMTSLEEGVRCYVQGFLNHDDRWR